MKKYIIDLDLGVKVTDDVAKYPLHHVTYSGTKFEVSSSGCLGGDALIKDIIRLLTLRLGQGHTKC